MKFAINFASSILLILSLFNGCISTNFIGDNYPETNSVQIYYSVKEITTDYFVFGHIVSSTSNSLFVSAEDLKDTLIEEAMRRGADGIVVNGIDIENWGESEIRKINASLIKIKDRL